MKYWFNISLVSLFTGCLLPGWADASAPDWPQWMGPKRDGISAETGLLQSWPAGGPRLLWKAKGLGDGFSSVAVVGQRIYTMGDRGEANYVIALDRATGKEVWAAKVGKAGAPGWGGFKGPRVTPTVDGDRLYAVGQYGEVVCLETATGKELWRKDYAKDFGAKRPEWGYTGSPLVDGDQVIVTPGGAEGDLVALDKKTGKLRWRSKDFTDSIHYSSPVVAVIGGVRQYIQLTEKSVGGVAAKDGRLLWRVARRGRTAVIPTPLVDGNLVYVTSGYGAGCNLFKITKAGNAFSAEEVYKNKVMVNHHGGALKCGDYVYGYSDGKGWTCQDFKTGEAKWQTKKPLGKGSIAFADGRLYLREEAGKSAIVLIEASPAGYKECGRFEQPDRSKAKSWPHPVVVNGKLYIRDQDILLCYDVKA